MKSTYSSDLEATLALDDDERVRQILHTEQRWHSDSASPLAATIAYLYQVASVFAIPEGQLSSLAQSVSFDEPRDQPMELRLAEEKRFFDSVTYGFYQTLLNVPVWQAGLSVTLDQNPLRVVVSTNTSQQGVAARLPATAAIERYRQVFRQAEAGRSSEENPTLPFLLGLLGAAGQGADTQPSGRRGINRGRFFLYNYDESRRLPRAPDPDPGAARPGAAGPLEDHEPRVALPLPPVPREIVEGSHYLVAELVFSWPVPRWGLLTWRALVEVETDAVLHLEALVAGVNGWVFPYDPITATGDTSNSADKSNAVLNPLRKAVALSRLRPPVAGVQSLAGDTIQIFDDPEHPPRVAPPTEPAGSDFKFDVRSDEFSAVNAYYHADQVFARIADLGFPLADYFDGTAFPVEVDHRDTDDVNAHCFADRESDGIGLVGFGLSARRGEHDTPIGRAIDKWVHWHEIGGHGILLDHVHSLNFGFAHSAGDGLAALQNDPESRLRGTAGRFRYAPFLGPLPDERRFDREVSRGWAWGGANDSGPFGMAREQILATTHFRIYRALGGDAREVSSRWFASRAVTYLILRAVSILTPATNPGEALLFCQALMAADLLRWTTEGLAGGAYNKVIRWAFEKQGLFQPLGAPPPITKEGDPPEVDVYIEDGRQGEYSYKADSWNNPSLWNRMAPDGGTAHQPPVPGVESYAYAKVKNRGTKTARRVLVQGYHAPPGAGFRWPQDFVPMRPPAGLKISSLGPRDSEEATVGPFAWTPDPKFYGHDGLLMIASVEGDPSNVSRLTAGESLEEWRLVPHDNNVGLRRVHLVPADSAELRGALHGSIFVAGNPFHQPAEMELRLRLPSVLTTHRWLIRLQDLPGMRFDLQPGETRKIVLELSGGRDFSREDVRLASDRDVSVELLANGVLLGGTTYRLDPAPG